MLYPNSRRPVEELVAMVTPQSYPMPGPCKSAINRKAPATVRVAPLKSHERGLCVPRHLRQEERNFRPDRTAAARGLSVTLRGYHLGRGRGVAARTLDMLPTSA